ncbi:hypothetical protein [Aneurinibacillus thermoaerophilus]|uniref:hypothetical protein n=1 Tax=Aneurinibacillus thermoaerophilus TaxID=143495 RepID=UPI002E1EA0DF|nr:hypothetical protein [Aneurinibacillus thermoaerophilus]
MLEHSPHWLNRKFWQAIKEKRDANRQRIMEGAQSLFILVDSIFNKGKGLKDILPDNDLKRVNDEKKEKQSQYVANVWWKPGQK